MPEIAALRLSSAAEKVAQTVLEADEHSDVRVAMALLKGLGLRWTKNLPTRKQSSIVRCSEGF